MPDPTPDPAVLSDARARLIEYLEKPPLGGNHHVGSAYSVERMKEAARLLATPPASDAAVPAGEEYDVVGWAKAMAAKGGPHEWGYRDVATGEFISDPWPFHAVEYIVAAAAPKVASDTGAGLRVERAAQAIYEAGGSFSDQNGVIAWADLEGSTDAENFRKMARAALATDATDEATGGGEEKPFAYFQRNEGWDMWEQVADEYAQDDSAIVAAYRHPPTSGGDLLEQAAKFMRHDGLCAIIGGYGYCSCGMEAARKALSPARDGGPNV